MHPAYSVIFFTTASGAGYGLMALLGLSSMVGIFSADFGVGITGLGLAFGLIISGLLSSTGHLGHKERAWRAFTQWRTSWLSREGVAALATFVPAGLFAIGWIIFRQTNGWVAVAGLVTAMGSAVTVFSTAMIYASLKPIPHWHNGRTVPSYLIFSLMTGLVILNAVVQVFARSGAGTFVGAACLATAFGLGWKLMCWHQDDRLALPATLGDATGLVGGTVRSIEWPHTEENYVLKEMGFRVARKHRVRLRVIALSFGFLLPVALLLIALGLPGVGRAIASAVAAVSQLFGMLVERWLFFAEAKHTVTLYYGRS